MSSGNEIPYKYYHVILASVPIFIGSSRWLLGNEFREAFQTEQYDLTLIIAPWFIILGALINWGGENIGIGRCTYISSTILNLIIYLLIWSLQVKAFGFYRRNFNDLEITTFPPVDEFEQDIYFVIMGSFVNCCQDEVVAETNLTCAEFEPTLPCVPAEDEDAFREIQEGMGGSRAVVCNNLRSSDSRGTRYKGFSGRLKACDDGIEIYARDALGHFRRGLFGNAIGLFIYSTFMIFASLCELLIGCVDEEADFSPEANKEIEVKGEELEHYRAEDEAW